MSVTLTWTCMVCGDERPDDKISVFKGCVSERFNMTMNVRYCNDRPDCVAGAPYKVTEMRNRLNSTGESS